MLTEKEYKETMADDMVDVTMTTESAIDIWPYVQQLALDKVVLDCVYENELVEKFIETTKGHLITS